MENTKKVSSGVFIRGQVGRVNEFKTKKGKDMYSLVVFDGEESRKVLSFESGMKQGDTYFGQISPTIRYNNGVAELSYFEKARM